MQPGALQLPPALLMQHLLAVSVGGHHNQSKCVLQLLLAGFVQQLLAASVGGTQTQAESRSRLKMSAELVGDVHSDCKYVQHNSSNKVCLGMAK